MRKFFLLKIHYADITGLFIARVLWSFIFLLERHPIVDHLEHIVQVLHANLQLNVDNLHWKIP
jgi:hypothetical protein